MEWSRLQHAIPFEKDFRWRGGQISRIEAFADAVFALSVTLLVVSAEVPRSYGEFIAVMKALPAFALSFVLVVLAWYFHFIHFRRYGIEDGPTLFLNLLLLFTVLVYVYPLKLMWAFLSAWAVSGMDAAIAQFDLDAPRVGVMLVVYGAGFVAMYALLGLMTLHALRLRDALELNEVEVAMTRGLLGVHCIQAGVGVLSILLALLLPTPYEGMAGFAYLLLPVVHPLHGRWEESRKRAALERMRSTR